MTGLATFFRITPPEGTSSADWAKRMWDTYGFDYDRGSLADSFVAWPSEGSTEDLKQALDADNIEYGTFEYDPDRYFGMPF